MSRVGDGGSEAADRWAMGVALELARSCDYATSPKPHGSAPWWFATGRSSAGAGPLRPAGPMRR